MSVRGSEQQRGSFASARHNTSVWTEGTDKFFCETVKLATGIYVSSIAVYGDEVLQNLLFASSTNNSKAFSP
jgi:hypothetical protein